MRSYLTTKSYEGRAISSLILVVFVFSLLFYAFHHSPSRSQTSLRPSRNGPVITAQRRFLSLSVGANSTIAAHLRELTLRPHLAGTPSADAVADYVLSQFRLAGIETMTREYSPLLSYPGAASISLLSPNGSLIKHLPLAEPADPDARVVPPYHAYSPSGSALAPAVFVGFGLEEDYEVLDRLGVVVKGCVAVVRSGRVYRGAAVERAAARGAKAVLMFGAGDGGGVERGTVMLRSVGDPLTPGWAAAVGAEEGEMLGLENEEVRKRFPNIPSMPVAAVVVEEILRTLSGPPVPQEWREGLGMKAGGVGPGPTLVNFTYREDRRFATIRNDFGIIVGHEEPDRFVILGNHRDAWTYGAVDPNSGTAALLDVARRYGIMMRSGWRPRRTIILCSWDAEEFGMIGSTEWVEQSLQNLALKAVAYLNVDCAVQGPGFFAGATPQLDDLLIAVTKQVKDPDLEEKTVYDTWVAANGGISIERLARANSDFSAFLHHAGVSSLDLYFGKDFPVYHTALDCYEWMEKHGDPSFHRHVALAEIWGLLGLHIADDVILPLSYLSYAVQLQDHTNTLSAMLGERVSMQPMNMSIHKLIAAANEIQGAAQKLQEDENTEFIVELRRRALNDRMMLAERSFLEAEGLNGRQWFKHVLYAPPEDYESKLSFFPGVADAISRSEKFSGMEGAREIQHEIWRVARAIERAAGALRGEIA